MNRRPRGRQTSIAFEASKFNLYCKCATPVVALVPRNPANPRVYYCTTCKGLIPADFDFALHGLKAPA